MHVIVSFISPITPTSTFRQSIPASYIKIYVEGSFNISIYIDINGDWVSGSQDSKIEWEFAQGQLPDDGGLLPLKTWKVKRSEELLFTEINDRAEWGTLYFTGPADAGHESGFSAKVRNDFKDTGRLRNENDVLFRNINQDEPVFAFSKAFQLKSPFHGGNGSSQDSVLFTIAHVQDPVAQFASGRGLTLMRPLWASWFGTTDAMISYHYLDFYNAFSLATNYSGQLAKDALMSGSTDYKDIVALSARQVMGATSFSGTTENPLLFLKEISSNGDFQTVDVIFPAFPFFLYTNPQWLAYLLEPLLEHQLSGQYPNKYSMHDLGIFPNGTGYPDGRDEYMPVEECGNMLIMGLALVNTLKYQREPASPWSSFGGSDGIDSESEDGSVFPLSSELKDYDNTWAVPVANRGQDDAQKWLGKSHALWKQWTGYLIRETLLPHHQLSTDDFAGWLANQTNLALKGIIGIRAMSGISEVLGLADEAAHYCNISDIYIEKWEEYGISRDGTHAKVAYTWYGSWTTLYNLFADSLLCFHLPGNSGSPPGSRDGGRQKPLGEFTTRETNKAAFIPDRIYKIQSDWYHNVLQRYGLPLDSRHLYTKSDWEFFAAAVTSKQVRGEILQSIALWVNETVTDRPLTDLYETEGKGEFPGINFFARPVVGGHFAFLALERACDGKAMDGLAFLNE